MKIQKREKRWRWYLLLGYLGYTLFTGIIFAILRCSSGACNNIFFLLLFFVNLPGIVLVSFLEPLLNSMGKIGPVIGLILLLVINVVFFYGTGVWIDHLRKRYGKKK
jgi:hypothetical protein